MPEYKPQTIEKKWQERWQATRAFEVTEDPGKPKFYCLEMFAYPSGHAHVGHVRNYMIGDVVARMKRMRGFGETGLSLVSGIHRVDCSTSKLASRQSRSASRS